MMAFRSRLVSIARRFGWEPVARRVVAVPRKIRKSVTHRVTSAVAAFSFRLDVARRLPEQSRSFRAYRQLLARPLSLEELLGAPDGGAVAVVVCLWNRPERLTTILSILDAQRGARPVRLLLWNNQPRDSRHYRHAIETFVASGSLSSVEYFDSPHNIGGMARFVVARHLVSRGYLGGFLMMDDDQNFGPSFVKDLLRVSAPRSVAGVWAWTNSGAYWNRHQVRTTGAHADHVGTGGSVCDSAIVNDPNFFLGIPAPYLFMEDMWMTHYAARNGWTLSMVESPFTFALSARDQGHALFDRKEHFFSWLALPGRVPVRPVNSD